MTRTSPTSTFKAQDLTILFAAHPLDDFGDDHFDSIYDFTVFVALFPLSSCSVPIDDFGGRPRPELQPKA